MGDITKSVGSTVHSVPVEKNAEGGIIPGLPVPANVKYSIDNPTNGTLVQNADGSADVTGLAAGDVSLSWVDTNEPNIPASVKVLTFTLDNAPASLDQQLS